MMAAALAAAALAGCDRARPLAVTHGWVRLPANPAAPAAAYFTVEGSQKPDTLAAVSVDGATKAEMHETMTMAGSGGMTGMAPLARVAVPAGGEVAFKPGGRHVMLFGLGARVKPGGTMAATFTFANGVRLVAPLKVVGPADPAPY